MKRVARRAWRRCEGASGVCQRPALHRYHGGPVRWDAGHSLCFRCHRALGDSVRLQPALVA
jgi:hypothetical protein